MQVVKTVFIALWISAATLGAMYGIPWLTAAGGDPAASDEAYSGFKTKTLSIPVFSAGKVAGYAILRFEGEVDTAFQAAGNPPLEVAQNHAAYAVFQFLGGQIDATRPKTVDREMLAAQLATALDRMADHPVVRNIVITQLEFLQRQRTPAG